MRKMSKAIKALIRKYAPFYEAMYLVIKGVHVLKKIRHSYGENIHFFLMRGATGDTYIQLALLPNYIRENNIQAYRIVGDSQGRNQLISLYGEKNYIEIDAYSVVAIEKAYMLLGAEKLGITIMFPWTYSLYFNRCRLRMLQGFHFMDTYRYYVFGLKKEPHLYLPEFAQLSQRMTGFLQEKGAKRGQTVIIAPEANSITELNEKIWNEIIVALKLKGYTVLINSKKENVYEAPTIFTPYAQSVALLEYCGYFIGLRSGLCDIISSAKCRKIILYPQLREQINYSEHRTEIDFCGLKVMGLVPETDNNLAEIESGLLRNITDKEKEDSIEHTKEQRQLIRNILAYF